MRIVHVITRLIVGGAQENTLLTCEGLAARGHEVILVSGPTHGPEGSLVTRASSGPYTFVELPSLVRQICPLSDYRALRALQRQFENWSPDVVHTHSSKAGILGRMAASAAKAPRVVHTIHGMSFNRTQPALLQKAYAAAERFCARKTNAIISVADAMTKQSLAAGVGRPGQYETIRSGIIITDYDPAKESPAEARGAWGAASDQFVVGTVARLFYNKGYEQLIEVMHLAVRDEPRLLFVWVGDGAARPVYEAALARRGLAGHVRILGLVSPEQMPSILSGIDILAHTSQWEGLPRAVVQSLLMEKPVVSFSIDGAPEVVLPGQTGELFAIDDFRGFADAIVSLARDPVRRRKFGEEGRRQCIAEFDHNRMVDQIEALYGRLPPA